MGTIVKFIWKYKSGQLDKISADHNEECITTHEFDDWPTSEAECHRKVNDYLSNTEKDIPTVFKNSWCFVKGWLFQKYIYVYSGYNIGDINWESSTESPEIFYTFEATYRLLDSDNLYSIDNDKLYQNAEPYFYGEGAPDGGYFLPIGEDNKPTTNEFKVQRAESNGYSKINYIEEFKIDDASLAYIEKGTFPIISDSHLIKEFDDSTNIEVKYETDGKTIKSIKIGKTTYTKDNLDQLPNSDHKLTELPTTLGFVLVGSGGGAGGISQYDTKKDGSTGNQYAYAGGGGGGGEIVWGVLKLDAPIPSKNASGHYMLFGNDLGTTEPTITYIQFTIVLGTGGVGGAPGNWMSTTHKKPQYGSAGTKGFDSTLSVKVGYKANNKTTSTNGAFITYAYGGKGGAAGINNGKASGGEGGTILNHSDKFPAASIAVIKRKKGGNGASVDSSSDVQHSSYEVSIYPGNSCPDNDKYLIAINHNENTGTGIGSANDGKKNAWKNTEKINSPGGHSFGNGATKTNAATKGGGGASCRHYDKDEDEKNDNTTGHNRPETYDDGADGFFAVYY